MKKILEKIHLPNWVVGILALVIILRIPSFFEPYNYGDEMVYLTLGQGVRQGLTLYKDIHDNKPPLLYLTAALAGNLFWFKVILAFWNLFTIVLFYKLSKILFEKSEGAQKLATLIFALLTTLPLFEGLTVNSELFMIGLTIAALLLLLKDGLTGRKVLFAGVLFGLGTLFKVPAAFDAPIIIFYWLITEGLGQWKKIFKNTLILLAGFAIPILITIIYYFFAGALKEYITGAFLQNIGYLSSFRPGDVQKPFLVRNAPLLLRAATVLIGSTVIYIFRNKLSKRFVLATLWTLFALFAITLSERPYPHYFVQALAPISILLATLFTQKSLEQSFTILPLALAFSVPFIYRFYYYSTTPYYVRFIKFATGKLSRDTYFNSFNGETTRNYKIAQFLVVSSASSDRVFMWDSDSPTVYALSRRLPPIKYVVPYHVHDFSSTNDVIKDIAQNPPKFIILTSDNPLPEIQPLIRKSYLLVYKIDNAEVFSKISLVKTK